MNINKRARFLLLALLTALTVNASGEESAMKPEAGQQDTSSRLFKIAADSYYDCLDRGMTDSAKVYLAYLRCRYPMFGRVGRMEIFFHLFNGKKAEALTAMDTFLVYHSPGDLMVPVETRNETRMLEKRLQEWSTLVELPNPADELFLKGFVQSLLGKRDDLKKSWGRLSAQQPDYPRLREMADFQERQTGGAMYRWAVFYDLYRPLERFAGYYPFMNGGGMSFGGRWGRFAFDITGAGFGARAAKPYALNRDGRLDTNRYITGFNGGIVLRTLLAARSHAAVELLMGLNGSVFDLAEADSSGPQVYPAVTSAYASPHFGFSIFHKSASSPTATNLLGLEALFHVMSGGRRSDGASLADPFWIHLRFFSCLEYFAPRRAAR